MSMIVRSRAAEAGRPQGSAPSADRAPPHAGSRAPKQINPRRPPTPRVRGLFADVTATGFLSAASY